MRVILVFFSLLILGACADKRFVHNNQGTTINSHLGGQLREVPVKMMSLKGPIRVKDTCQSACTSILVRNDVCTYPDAIWKFHGAQGWLVHISQEKRPLTYDLLVANWYTNKPGMREWFLSGDLNNWKTLTGKEMNDRGWIPLCE